MFARAGRDPVCCSVAVNESSTRVARVAVGGVLTSQLLAPILRSNGQRQHQQQSSRPASKAMGGKLFQGGEPRPSCRQSRQAEANTMRASSRAYCWRCVAFPLSCSKRAPRPDPDPSLRRIDQTCLASCPASIRVEACGVEKEPFFLSDSNQRRATSGKNLPARRIAAFVSIPHPKTC